MRNTYRPVIPSQLAAVKPAFASAKPALLMHRGSCRCCSPLELIAYPILETIGCSLTEEHQSFTCGDSWVSHFISPLLNLPMLFSNAREFTFGARASFGRGFTIYLFDAIFILALAYPLLILFSRKGGRHLVPPESRQTAIVPRHHTMSGLPQTADMVAAPARGHGWKASTLAQTTSADEALSSA